jgi:hypothetical protein
VVTEFSLAVERGPKALKEDANIKPARRRNSTLTIFRIVEWANPEIQRSKPATDA